jgi:hypothetical protein
MRALNSAGTGTLRPPGERSSGYTWGVASTRGRGKIRPRILIAHPDHEWVDQARSRLLSMGYLVNECFELDWVPDILGGSIPYDLALLSNEMDPCGQASILDLLKKKGCPTKVVLLLDDLDGPTMQIQGQTGMPTHRLSQGVDELTALVVAQIGPPPEPKPV